MDRDVTAWAARAEPAALRSAVGLSWVDLEAGWCRQRLVPAPAVVSHGGRISMTALAVLVDSTLGTAAATAANLPAVVTSGLRIDLRPGWAEAEMIMATGRAIPGSNDFLLATGELVAGRAPIGVATVTCRPVTIPKRPGGARSEESPVATGSEPGRVVSLEEFLGVRAVRATGGTAHLVADARPALANGAGTLHGGVVAGLGHFAACWALGAERPWVPLGLEVDFVRAIRADGGILHTRSRVAAQTRNYAWVEAVVMRKDGRIAARVRCLHCLA